MYEYYGINLFFYDKQRAELIRKKVIQLIDRVYFPDKESIIFKSNMSKNELFELNKKAADKLIKLYDNSNIKYLLKKCDRDIFRVYLRKENILHGINIIDDLKTKKGD